MSWKYVMLRTKVGTLEIDVPVIFPDKLVHADVARAIAPLLPGKFEYAVGAGQVNMLEVRSVEGRSESMGIASRGHHDAKVINTYDYTHGVV